MTTLLPQRFFARDAVTVAAELLGKRLVHGDVTLAITETEAYVLADTASHARFGRTARNAAMWGPAGHAYVFVCYGLHQMLNVVTDAEDVGAAVLVRACEPVAGLDRVRDRRGRADGPALLTGPGKVAQALAVDGAFNHHPLYEPGGLELHDAPPPGAVLVGPRVGIDYASPADRDAPWRFAVADTAWVTHRRALAPAPTPRIAARR